MTRQIWDKSKMENTLTKKDDLVDHLLEKEMTCFSQSTVEEILKKNNKEKENQVVPRKSNDIILISSSEDENENVHNQLAEAKIEITVRVIYPRKKKRKIKK